LEQAAEKLGVAIKTVKRMIEEKILPATQVVPCAPWRISAEFLASDRVHARLREIRTRDRRPQVSKSNAQAVLF
jgi:hypothetical protein